MRNKWSLVMSEVECRRARALAAEEQLASLHELLQQLKDWIQGFHSKISSDQVRTLTVTVRHLHFRPDNPF